jgi:hypothetical protein
MTVGVMACSASMVMVKEQETRVLTYQLRLDFDSHLDGSGCGSVDARRSLGYHGSRRPPLTRMKR